jgi:hypothetical protein
MPHPLNMKLNDIKLTRLGKSSQCRKAHKERNRLLAAFRVRITTVNQLVTQAEFRLLSPTACQLHTYPGLSRSLGLFVDVRTCLRPLLIRPPLGS